MNVPALNKSRDVGRLNSLPLIVGSIVTLALAISFGISQSSVWSLKQDVFATDIYFTAYGAVMLFSLVLVILGGKRRPLVMRTGKAMFIGGVLWGIIGVLAPTSLLFCRFYQLIGIPSTCFL